MLQITGQVPNSLAELVGSINVTVQSSSKFRKFQRQYANDRIAFAYDIMGALGRTVTIYQEEILGYLDDGYTRVAVRGPHGLGKTFLAALLAHHSVLTAEMDAKTITTASAWRQLEKYLWPEIHKLARFIRWDMVGREQYNLGKELLETSIKLSSRTVEAFAVASDDYNTIEGAHARQMIYIFDEAKTIPRNTWNAAEGAFSNTKNAIISDVRLPEKIFDNGLRDGINYLGRFDIGMINEHEIVAHADVKEIVSARRMGLDEFPTGDLDNYLNDKMKQGRIVLGKSDLTALSKLHEKDMFDRFVETSREEIISRTDDNDEEIDKAVGEYYSSGEYKEGNNIDIADDPLYSKAIDENTSYSKTNIIDENHSGKAIDENHSGKALNTIGTIGSNSAARSFSHAMEKHLTATNGTNGTAIVHPKAIVHPTMEETVIENVHPKANVQSPMVKAIVHPKANVQSVSIENVRLPVHYATVREPIVYNSAEANVQYSPAMMSRAQYRDAQVTNIGTTERAYAFAISTPGDPSGQFYDIHMHAPGYEDWKTRHVTVDEAIKAGRISADWVAQRKRQWGEDSSIFQNRVLGEFADSSEEGIIPLSWVRAANERWKDWQAKGHKHIDGRKSLGVDVARGGADKTVIARCMASHVTELLQFSKLSTTTISAFIKSMSRGYEIHIEMDGGLGAAVYDMLKDESVPMLKPIVVNSSTTWRDRSKELRFTNVRAAMWWHVRELLDPEYGSEMMLPPVEELILDLSTPRWEVMKDATITLESKDDIRDRLGRSTDYGDAVCLALWQRSSGGGMVF